MQKATYAIVICAAIATAACGGGDGGGGGSSPAGIGTLWATSEDLGHVRRVDSATGEYVDIEVGEGTEWVATGAGAVWVTTASSSVLRIDPAAAPQSAISATIPVGSRLRGIAASDAAVWVTDDGNGTETPSVHRIDPATNAVIASIPLEVIDEPVDILIGPDAVYVCIWNNFAVARIDPATNTIANKKLIGQSGGYGYGELTHANGSLWVVDQYSHLLIELDPTTLEKKNEQPVGDRFSGEMIWAGGELFVSDLDGEVVLDVDPASASVQRELAPGGRPSSLAAKGSTLLVGLADVSGGDVVLFDAPSGDQQAVLPAIYPDAIAIE